jgi:hypothetical protein
MSSVTSFGRGAGWRLAIPPPLQAPFDACEFKERDPALLAICSQALGHPVRPPLVSSRVFANALWWFCLTVLMFSVIRFGCGPSGVAGAALLVAFAVKSLHWLEPAWRLTPRGVDVQGVGYAPADTILLITRGAAWDVTLYRAGIRHTRLATGLECIALLAVWQGAYGTTTEACTDGQRGPHSRSQSADDHGNPHP